MEYDSSNFSQFIFLFNTTNNTTGWGSMFLLSLIVLILILLNFIIAGAEVAFFSLNNDNLKQLEKDYRVKKILYLLSKPKELLGAMIIANTFINLFIIFLINIILGQLLYGLNLPHLQIELIKIGIEVFIILLFAEVLPKHFASQQNIQFVFFSLSIVQFIFKITYKLSYQLNKISTLIEKKISHYNIKKTNHNHSFEELKHAIEIMTDRDEKKEEISLINSIIDFQKKRVKQIMKPRIDVVGIDYNSSFAAVKKNILQGQFSRFPVYKKNLDNMVGILNTKYLLPYINEKTNFKWQKLITTPVYILENLTLELCLKQMRENKIHLAIVIDEFGSTQGIISFEDIVEEVVGEIRDEFDTTENKVKNINKSTHLFNAKISIQDFATFLQIPINWFEDVRNESDSLAGLLLELWKEIPKEKETIVWKNLKFTIVKIKNNRIHQIKVKILPHHKNESNEYSAVDAAQ